MYTKLKYFKSLHDKSQMSKSLFPHIGVTALGQITLDYMDYVPWCPLGFHFRQELQLSPGLKIL